MVIKPQHQLVDKLSARTINPSIISFENVVFFPLPIIILKLEKKQDPNIVATPSII